MTSDTRTSKVPYAPPATIIDVIRHYRNFDVPDEIVRTDLLRLNVSEGLLARTWAALAYLDLIHDDGTTTEKLRNLRFASEDEYPAVLRGIIEDAYADVFRTIDPTTAEIGQLDGAFRFYVPGGQRRRMITLFLGLCREAGIETHVELRERSSSVGGKNGATTRKTANTTTKKGNVAKEPGRQSGDGSGSATAARAAGLDAVKAQYASILLKKIEESDEPSEELLNRLERVLGLHPGE